MQGGHGETLRPLRFFIGSKHDDESGNESEISVEEDITLGKRLDSVVYHLREIVGVFLAWPIAVCCGYATINQFRKHKLEQVWKGTETLVRIQKHRNAALDVYFQIFSFCAEEEFYLIVLPLLCWNVDHALARRLMIVVCSGLLIGNFLKDIFRLPRPKSPPVWRPSHAEAMDSSNLQDFGFPSTHTMNAISNSFYVLFHYGLVAFAPFKASAPAVLLMVWYASSMMVSRLYLGAHTGTDIRGGLILGMIVVVASLYSDPFERAYMATEELHWKMLGGISVFLFLNPQPQPRTPTFEQNALCCGLIWGVMEGTTRWLSQGAVASSLLPSGAVEVQFRNGSVEVHSAILAVVYRGIRTMMVEYPVVGIPVKTVLGYVVVLIFRALTKGLLTAVLEKVFGIQVKAKIVEVDEPASIGARKKNDDLGKGEGKGDKGEEKEGKPATPHKKRRIVMSRDTSRVGNAVVKVATYTLISFNVSFTVPMIYYYTGFNA